KNPENTPQENFDIFWQTFKDKYTFFSIKNVDWDSLYTHYDPMVNTSTSDEDLFAIMDSMMYLLEDEHVNLVSDFNVSRNWNWYIDYPANFNASVLERNYLESNHRIAGGLKYTIIDSVGYIYYGSFS